MKEKKTGSANPKTINRRDFLKSSATLLAGAGALNILSSIGCGARHKDMNVLFVSLDTLRADHCRFMGYNRETTTFLDRYAKDSIVFNQMHTPTPWTDQSHASIFSSLYPRVHSISFFYNNKLRFSLASILKNYGYTTAGFVEAIPLDPRVGGATGFDTYMKIQDPENYFNNRAEHNNMRVAEWLKKNHQKKFFGFVHYFDIHHPYQPEPPYDKKFYKGEIDERSYRLGNAPYRQENASEGMINQAKVLYDGEIAYTDHHLQNLLSMLDDYGLTDRTVVVIFSDHGEGFFEHKLFSHGNSLYEELLRIPTVMHLPDSERKGTRVSSITRSIDIMPTILDYLGAETKEPLQGVSLLPMIEKGEERDLLLYADGIRYAMSVLKGKHKLIYNHSWQDEWTKELGFTKPTYELYNLEEDPGEQKNLAEEKKDLRDELYADIHRSWEINRKWKKGFIMGQKKKMDEDLEKGLRQLNYITG